MRSALDEHRWRRASQSTRLAVTGHGSRDLDRPPDAPRLLGGMRGEGSLRGGAIEGRGAAESGGAVRMDRPGRLDRSTAGDAPSKTRASDARGGVGRGASLRRFGAAGAGRSRAGAGNASGVAGVVWRRCSRGSVSRCGPVGRCPGCSPPVFRGAMSWGPAGPGRSVGRDGSDGRSSAGRPGREPSPTRGLSPVRGPSF